MSGLSIKQWRGLVALSRDAVVSASHAVERVHLETAGRPLGALERVPVVAAPTAVVRGIHDAVVTSVHAVIRLTTQAVGAALDIALHAAERAARDEAGPGPSNPTV